MKYAICNEIFRDWEWEDIVDYVSSIGYDGIELAPFTVARDFGDITGDKTEALREKACSKGLEIIGLHWLLVAPEGLSLSSPDVKTRRKTAGYLKSLILFCSNMGGRLMVLGSPKQRNIHPGSTYRETYGYVKDIMNEVLPLAEDKGVHILIEPLGREVTNFITTAREAVQFIEDINHPNLRLNLDVKAMCSEDRPISEIIESSKGYLEHFHANDPNGGGPGSGKLDYARIKHSLEKLEYSGYVSVEVFDLSMGAEQISENSIRYLRGIFEA